MGVDKRPPLPAPTEDTESTTGGTEISSKVTNKTHYSLAEDGTPITIPTRRNKKDKDSPLTSNKSQTSLLIEYFEGGKGSHSERRPSVRVKVTPSSKSRSRSANDHIQITERKGSRKPSYTKRIQLSPEEGDDHSLNSYRSATEESNVTSRGGDPIEVEIMPRRHGSPLIPTGEKSSAKYVQQNASEISSMPADSFLDGKQRSPERKRSRSLTRDITSGATRAAAGLVAGEVVDKLRTPSRRRSRSLSRERIVAQKAVEKVRGDKSERRRKHSSRSRSVSAEQHTEEIKSPRRRSSRSRHEESMISGADSSLLNSHLSGKSGDQYSFRSGTSKSSINNPKLLETVEDAIRRLILPELTALKREQSKHQYRDRRGSLTSGSGVSRDSREESTGGRRLSERGSGTDLSSRPKVILNDSEVLSGNSIKGRKDKNVERVLLQESPKSFERETSEDTVVQDGERLHKKRSSGHRGLKTAAAGAGIGALTAAALHKHQSQESIDEKKERRRRRTKSHSRSDSLAESYEEHQLDVPPVPLPLMSDINASEITRSSILSAETDRPNSASQERVTPLREVPRGYGSPSSRTPTRTPVALQQGLGTQHSNFSRGNLSLHSQPSEQHLRSQEYELDERGNKISMYDSQERDYEESFVEDEQKSGGKARALVAGLAGATAGVGLASAHPHYKDGRDDSEVHEEEEDVYYTNNQDVPAHLQYRPYGAERRGLSPIQSVSGYTEGDPEPRQRDSRLTHSTGSYSSLNKSVKQGRSMRSLDSLGNVHNRHDFADIRQGGLTDSELTQEGEYWEEQHRENDRNRGLDSASYHSSDPRMDYKHQTNYTDDSFDATEEDRVATGQNVRGLGANPDYVHTPMAVESAVASLVNASELTGPSGHNGRYDRRNSNASFEEGEERQFTTSRGNSPHKAEIRRELSYDESDRGASRLSGSPEKYDMEYDIDENGRKVEMPKYKNSHTAAKAGLAGIAAGAAAAVLAGRNRKSDADQIHFEAREEHTGAPLQKSFKERALEGQGQIPSPRHSVDGQLSEIASREQLKLGASGLPDMSDPMPEIGYGDGDSDITNPSLIHGPIGGKQVDNTDHWPSQPTPPQARLLGTPTRGTPSRGTPTRGTPTRGTPTRGYNSNSNLKAAGAALAGAAIGAGGVAALGGHSRDNSQNDEWQRTSDERKRDTLITNPYEGTSPIAAIGTDIDRDLLGQPIYRGLHHNISPVSFANGSPLLPKDEGYISSAPNARSPGAVTPEPRAKGVGFLDQDLGTAADALGGGDPFYTPQHARHLSGMSHGMGSPLYDSATGTGIDRIQSKDIVALMDHLTVRDAQRNARDTEILVTLVRSAAEMRNSFEDMKRLLAETEDVIITEVEGNTNKSIQKAINGPRPQPQSAARSLRHGSQDEMYDDLPAKKGNVFRRAIKVLSTRNSNDLTRIEDMMVQILGEVEGLKLAGGKLEGQHGGSYDDLGQEGNYEHDHGYEPEGHAGTSTASHASQSGHLSIPRGPSASRPFDGRKFSDHRISTVPEGDEDELDMQEQQALDNRYNKNINNDLLQTPTRENVRGGSVPLDSPPQQYVAPASLSNENTPKTDKSKKHKSSSSSGWIPKVSRWSETTASTVLRGFRGSGRDSGKKGDNQYDDPPSRSGSDLGNYAENDPYGEDKLHTGFSQDKVNQYDDPMSLLPPEDPKYKAHRNSLNLQHPQPRTGHRYQTALESQAQNFDQPMSPRSDDWGSQTSLNRLPPHQQQTNRYSNTTNNTNPGNLSPVTDEGYSNGSAHNQAPSRPPKEPLGPERPPKIRSGNGKLTKPSPLSNEHLDVDDPRYSASYEQVESPRSAPRSTSGAHTGIPARKPTGPRSMSSTKSGGDLNRDEGTNLQQFII